MSQSIHIESGITVRLRRGFEPMIADKESQSQKSTRDGEPIWVAEAMMAGELATAYSDTDQPGAVRIRYVGPNPNLGPKTNVRLLGEVVARSWYQKGRGGMSASNVEIKVERVERSNDAPLMSGGIPVAIPSELPMECVEQAPDGTITLSVDPVGIYGYAGNGVVRVKSSIDVPVTLMCTDVRPVDLRLFYSRPDQEDVAHNRKAGLVFRCKGVQAPALAGVGNGRAPKRNEPQPEAPTSGEG